MSGIEEENKKKGRTTKKDLLHLVSGTTLAQIFAVIFYPILSRMFAPEDFGMLSLISTIYAIIIVFASGKYEQAIIVCKNWVESINMVAIAIGIATISCSALLLLLLLFSNPILTYINYPSLKGWIYFTPLIAYFVIIYNTFNEWCVKKGSFVSLATNKITNSGAINLSKFSFGLGGLSGGLVYGDLVGRGLSALSCIIHWLRTDKKSFKHISWKKMRMLMIKHINFPKFVIPDQLLNTLTGSLTTLSLSYFYGEETLGYYAMAMNISAIPMTFIGQSVMDVLRNKASLDYEKTGNSRYIYTKFLKICIPIIIVLFLSLFYFIPDIFVFILGKPWLNTGIFVQILSPAIALGFVSSIFMPIWFITGKQKNRFYWQIFYFFVMLLAIILGSVVSHDTTIAVICFSVGLSIAYSTNIYYTWKYSKKEDAKA